MQVVKGHQCGYPVPVGIAGPPCPRVYQYGGLTLHVCGWATGRQLFTVERLNVRKPKLCPRKSQTDWNRTRQWTRINGMRIANWNVHTLYREEAVNELMKYMDKHKVDIYILQEIG